jgi:predicted P-loop ATPase
VSTRERIDQPQEPDRETMLLEVSTARGCTGIDLERTQQGTVRSTLRNAVDLLLRHPRWHGAIAFDVRAEAPLFKHRPPAYAGTADVFPRGISDVDQTAIIGWLSYETDGTEFADCKVRRAIDYVARANEYDPVAEYLNALQWDGRSRLDDWLSTYLGVTRSTFARAAGPKFMISAVARALRPGCKVDHVLVLEGAQGIGKTTALSILGGRYHRADLPPLDSRDVKEALRGAWIVELGELASMNKSELDSAKNFLTLTEDTYRVPYGTRSETRPRRLVFAATTNEAEYLRDQSGNRRFWPVECKSIRLEALVRDRDQVWAEAVARLQRGEPRHLRGADEIDAARLEQDKRRERDPWEERVARHAAGHRDFTVGEVLKAIGVDLDRQTMREKRRVSAILQGLGYVAEQVRVGAGRTRVYRPRRERAQSDDLSRVSRDDSGSSKPAPHAHDSRDGTRDTRDNKAPNDEGSA